MFCIIFMAINAAQYWILHIIGDYVQLLNQPWYHMISWDVHLCPSLKKHLVAQGASCLQSMDWRRGNSVITLQDQLMSRKFGEITPIIGWNHWWSYISYKCIIAFSVLGTYIGVFQFLLSRCQAPGTLTGDLRVLFGHHWYRIVRACVVGRSRSAPWLLTTWLSGRAACGTCLCWGNFPSFLCFRKVLEILVGFFCIPVYLHLPYKSIKCRGYEFYRKYPKHPTPSKLAINSVRLRSW